MRQCQLFTPAMPECATAATATATTATATAAIPVQKAEESTGSAEGSKDEKDEAVESWIVDNYLLGTFTRALRDKWPQLEHCSEIRPPLPEGADGYDIFANGDIGWDNLGVALARVMAHSRTCWEEGED